MLCLQKKKAGKSGLRGGLVRLRSVLGRVGVSKGDGLGRRLWSVRICILTDRAWVQRTQEIHIGGRDVLCP
jgi:hypothetical protein